VLYLGLLRDEAKKDDRTVTPQKLAIIDLDGTLLKGTSAERSFFFFLVFRAKLGPVRLSRFTLTFLKDVARLGFRRAVGTNIAYLRGETPEQVGRWAAKYAGQSLADAVPAFLRLKLAVLKSEGYRVILLSGSLHVLVELFKEALGADLAIGQQIEVVGGKLTGKKAGVYPFGAEKLDALFAVIRREEVDWPSSWAMADRYWDLPVLELAGHPVAVHPDARLRRYAQQKGWEIIG
jgi:HAD superfamily phosphoserine phosphatase-like hydrolase